MPPARRARDAYDALEQARVEAIGAAPHGRRRRQPARPGWTSDCERQGLRPHDRTEQVPLAEALRAAGARGDDRRDAAAEPPAMRRSVAALARRAASAASLARAGRRAWTTRTAFARAARKLLAELDLEIGQVDESQEDEDGEDDDKADGEQPEEQGREGEQVSAEAETATATPEQRRRDRRRGRRAGRVGRRFRRVRRPRTPRRRASPGATDQTAPRLDPNGAELPGLHHPVRRGWSTPRTSATPTSWRGCASMLDQQLQHLQGVIAKLANRLQRRLLAKQTRAWEFDLEEGMLDAGRLARVVINPMHAAVLQARAGHRIPRHGRHPADRQFRARCAAGRSPSPR